MTINKSTVSVRDKGPVKNIPYIGRQGGVAFSSDAYAIEWIIDMLDGDNYKLSRSCKWDKEQIDKYKRYLLTLGDDNA